MDDELLSPCSSFFPVSPPSGQFEHHHHQFIEFASCEVQHACVSRVQGATVQDVVVDVPAALQHDDSAALRSALVQRLRDSA
uniref:Uncharacterized protein n=1 Tax=Aegilops tauschii TaxID=37682 RepID=N1QWR5_AEGTA